MNQDKSVALGISGGVDSAVSAQLLLEKGFKVIAVFMQCWKEEGCRSEEDRKDALKISLDLKIPFKALDFKKEYKQKVVDYFFQEYQKGRTPNPDILCNTEIKFGLFYNWAKKNNFDYIATGHYAKKITNNSQNYLAIPRDSKKDQTYFLHQITNEQLDFTIFPLENLEKKQVRAIAKEKKLHVYDKKDSVGICFIGDINVHNFLEERLGKNPGAVIDSNFNIIGEHQGLWFYTIGQRTGFKIYQSSLIKNSEGNFITRQNIPPFYVIKKIPKKNQLMVGFGAQTLVKNFKINQPHWINEKPDSQDVLIRIRHTGALIPGNLNNHEVVLDEKIQGIAPGQFAVFYQKINNEIICLGGAEISENE